jgi:hypothetical protein
MRVGRSLVMLGALALVFAGIAYLVVPGLALGIVGIASAPSSDFLLRTEGVALITAALLLWAVRNTGRAVLGAALLALAFYLVVGSVVDVEAFSRGVVGSMSVPSAAVRILFGITCAMASLRLRQAAR